MLNIGLWYVRKVLLEPGRVLAGASWVLIFPALRAVIMQTLQGAREVLTASGSRRQSQPFMSFSAGSLPNESVRFFLLAQPLPDAGYQNAILLLKRLPNSVAERSCWPLRWHRPPPLFATSCKYQLLFSSFRRSEHRSADSDYKCRVNKNTATIAAIPVAIFQSSRIICVRTLGWYVCLHLKMMRIEGRVNDKWAHFPMQRWLALRKDLLALFARLTFHAAAGTSEGFTPNLWALIYRHRSLHYCGRTFQQIGEPGCRGDFDPLSCESTIRHSSRWLRGPGFHFSLQTQIQEMWWGRFSVFHHTLESESLGVVLQADFLQTKFDFV